MLVAPIFTDEGEVTYYLPKGKWTHLISGDVVEGGQWLTETYDYFSLPLFVREHTILVLGKNDKRTDYDYTKYIELHLYQLRQGEEAKTVIYGTDSEMKATITAHRTSNHIIVTVDGQLEDVAVVVHDSLELTKGDEYTLVGLQADVNFQTNQQVVLNLA